MSSLVMYDYSSESENEDNHSLDSVSPINRKPYLPNRTINKNSQPGNRTSKPQKRTESIKIVIPSLKAFDNDNIENESINKKMKFNENGLLALLPAPKAIPTSNTSFVPNVLQRKINAPIIPSPKKILLQYATTEKKEAKCSNLATPKNLETEILETFDDETWQKACGRLQEKHAIQRVVVPSTNQNISNVTITAAPDVRTPYTGLSNKAFKDLVGHSKRVKESFRLIDIHEDDIRPDYKEWLKSLTAPSSEPELNNTASVNQVCKTKNHITSLAQKALANNEELQMKWSENRYMRKQTQAKYGF